MMGNNIENNRVLVVDDEMIILNMLQSFFLNDGYRCDKAMSGEEAIEMIREREFDILVTDIKLPGMNGFRLTEEALKVKPDLIVILITGFTEQFSYDNALEIGAADFIKKPFTHKELLVRIKQARMHRELSQLVIMDELTGLYNRKGFIALGGHILSIEKREKGGLFLLCADIDNLEQINSTWGHSEGDAALKEVARILQANYRESDVIARIGGDEFAVIPVRGDKNSAGMIVTRLQNEIGHQNEKTNRPYQLSISTGLAYFDKGASSSIENLLKEAEKAIDEKKE